MTRPLSLLGAGALLAATLLASTACSAPTSAPDSSKAPDPVATSPAPTPDASPTAAPAGDPTCETIISPAVVADFESVGWTVREEPLRAGEMEIPGGIQCVWGDFSVATDHVQIFGWAPIEEDDASEVQDHLVEAGWRVEKDPTGVIVTESSDTTVATDDEGYGLTYLFGDGWVKYADTKQGLILIVWPSSS